MYPPPPSRSPAVFLGLVAGVDLAAEVLVVLLEALLVEAATARQQLATAHGAVLQVATGVVQAAPADTAIATTLGLPAPARGSALVSGPRFG